MSRLKTMLLAVSATALTAFAAPTSHAADFYEGKVLTIILPNTPAGAMTQYARMIAPYIQKHSGARDVRIDNQPGAGSLRGTNMLWNAKPDGLTIAFTSLATLIIAQLAGSPGVNFDTGKMTYLGSVADDPRVLVTNPRIKTIEDIMKLDRPFVYPTQGTDEDFYTMAVLFNALGKQLKPVTGYQGDPDTSLAVIKGDGDGHMTSWATTMPGIKSDEKIPVLNMQDKVYPDFPNVPPALKIVTDPEKQKPLRTIIDILAVTRGYFGPPNMDPQAVADIRAAIGKALADPELIEESKKKGFPLSYYSGESETARIKGVMENGASLTPILKAAVQAIR